MTLQEFTTKYGEYGLDVLKSYYQVNPLNVSYSEYIPYVNKMLTAPGNTLQVRVAYSLENEPLVTSQHISKIVTKIINKFSAF